MQHEKRSTIRKNVSYDILVNHDFIDPRRWRTRDLCMDSVFVKMRTEAKLPGAWVEVVLLLDDADKTSHLCLPAEIIRVSKEGIVCKFRDYDHVARQKLRDILEGDIPKLAYLQASKPGAR